jgi:DNA repair exonuclease SbcCD nuclease subunit
MTRILLIGDVHYAQKYENELDNFEQEVREIIRDYNVEFIIFMGDVFDNVREKCFTETTLVRFAKFVRSIEKSVKIFILVGNHDLFDTHRKSFAVDDTILTHLFHHDENVIVIWEPTVVKLVGKNVIMTPYMKKNIFNVTIDGLLETFHREHPGELITMCFAHQEFYGSGYSRDNDVDRYNYKFKCYSGHIHKPTVNGSKSNVLYVGESFKHNYDDKIYACRYIILDNFVNEIFLTTECPLKIKIPISLEGCDDVNAVITEKLSSLSSNLRNMGITALCKCELSGNENIVLDKFDVDNIKVEFIHNMLSSIPAKDEIEFQCEESYNAVENVRDRVMEFINTNSCEDYGDNANWNEYLKCLGIVNQQRVTSSS